MKSTRALAAVLLMALVSGCAAKTVQRIDFPAGEYAGLATSGTAVVRGQAFLKTRGGDVKTAAGEEVLCNPVTSYSEQWYEVGFLKGHPLTEADPRYDRYIMRTIADGDGRFTFKDVPQGEYFVTTRVVWEAAVGAYGSLVPQGGYVTKRVFVEDGAELDLVITGR